MPPQVIAFIVFAYCMICLNIIIKKSKGSARSNENYLREEEMANFSRKKEIPENLFINAGIELLPMREFEDTEEFKRINKSQAYVIKRSTFKMIRLKTPMTNRELKIKFGYANLENIIAYEDNFVRYIFALCDWAETLLEMGEKEDAISILEFAVDMIPEQSKPYTLLIDAYGESKCKSELLNLKDKFNSNCKPLLQDVLNDRIESRMESTLKSLEKDSLYYFQLKWRINIFHGTMVRTSSKEIFIYTVWGLNLWTLKP